MQQTAADPECAAERDQIEGLASVADNAHELWEAINQKRAGMSERWPQSIVAADSACRSALARV